MIGEGGPHARLFLFNVATLSLFLFNVARLSGPGCRYAGYQLCILFLTHLYEEDQSPVPREWGNESDLSATAVIIHKRL
jgi:hypothetical protein